MAADEDARNTVATRALKVEPCTAKLTEVVVVASSSDAPKARKDVLISV